MMNVPSKRRVRRRGHLAAVLVLAAAISLGSSAEARVYDQVKLELDPLACMIQSRERTQIGSTEFLSGLLLGDGEHLMHYRVANPAMYHFGASAEAPATGMFWMRLNLSTSRLRRFGELELRPIHAGPKRGFREYVPVKDMIPGQAIFTSGYLFGSQWYTTEGEYIGLWTDDGHSEFDRAVSAFFSTQDRLAPLASPRSMIYPQLILIRACTNVGCEGAPAVDHALGLVGVVLGQTAEYTMLVPMELLNAQLHIGLTARRLPPDILRGGGSEVSPTPTPTVEVPEASNGGRGDVFIWEMGEPEGNKEEKKSEGEPKAPEPIATATPDKRRKETHDP